VVNELNPPSGRSQDAFFPRDLASCLPTIVAGDGVYLIDDRGRRLLDVCSGPFLAGLGQGNERVLTAMLDQGRRLTYTYSRSTRHEANAELTRRLAELAGPGLDRVLLTSGGSEAVEMAIKFLRAHAVARGEAQRERVITLMPGYHGATGSPRAWLPGTLRLAPCLPRRGWSMSSLRRRALWFLTPTMPARWRAPRGRRYWTRSSIATSSPIQAGWALVSGQGFRRWPPECRG
jgi:hypothetical protein